MAWFAPPDTFAILSRLRSYLDVAEAFMRDERADEFDAEIVGHCIDQPQRQPVWQSVDQFGAVPRGGSVSESV
ncbi:hypothetical protein [Paraburkholderia sp. C35]|uniref:hypothetical protein n=1 Tax=Paraburkholderia sp. C35 TaxID=2126993 RepID=UPI000D69FAA6|nr:hypothetical protein [Paraburkholderia sp. C35]